MIADKPIEVPGRWCAAAGFTLLEVMIAIGIMATTPQAQQALQQGKTEPITFVGEDRTQANNPADKLAFSTVLPTQCPDVPDTEMCHVTYSIEPVNEPSQGRALFRRVNCSVDPENSDQDRLFLLTELAYGLDFKYYDNPNMEYLDWNSRQPHGGKRMPARVKITLLLADQHGQLRPFEMITDFVLSR